MCLDCGMFAQENQTLYSKDLMVSLMLKEFSLVKDPCSRTLGLGTKISFTLKKIH